MKLRKGLSTATAVLALGAVGVTSTSAGASSAKEGAAAMSTTSQDVVQVAEHTPQLSTLVSALKAAGLVQTLEGSGPFTVFAPTNRAFAALPKGTVKSLLQPANKAALVSILTYHVVPGSLTASQLQSGPVKTVNGAPFTVSIAKGKVTITGGTGKPARVVKANIAASNGVIHIINRVLLPPANS